MSKSLKLLLAKRLIKDIFANLGELCALMAKGPLPMRKASEWQTPDFFATPPASHVQNVQEMQAAKETQEPQDAQEPQTEQAAQAVTQPQKLAQSQKAPQAQDVSKKKAGRTADFYVRPSQVKEVIEAQWDVRCNATNFAPEARRKGEDAPFRVMDERLQNSIIWSVQEIYPNCYRSLVDGYIRSEEVPLYFPLRDYLRALPAWDGRDRVGELAARISSDELWNKVFRRWLRGAVKGWLGEEESADVYDCQIAPLLVSERQGLGKSTFCRMLLPKKLRAYYTDKFDLTSDAHSEKLLVEYALISMDEFDRYSERQMATLKNLMQLTEVRVKPPRSRVYRLMRRMAAFIGTSNMTELLTDPTGSRRFFCQMVEAPISREAIDHDQLYAQVMAELAAGQPTFFSKEEEAEIEEHNRTFYRQSPLAEAFHKSFMMGEGSEATQWLSATEIFETLKRESPRALQGVKIAGMGRQLRHLGVLKKRTAKGVFYCVSRKQVETV